MEKITTRSLSLSPLLSLTLHTYTYILLLLTPTTPTLTPITLSPPPLFPTDPFSLLSLYYYSLSTPSLPSFSLHPSSPGKDLRLLSRRRLLVEFSFVNREFRICSCLWFCPFLSTAAACGSAHSFQQLIRISIGGIVL